MTASLFKKIIRPHEEAELAYQEAIQKILASDEPADGKEAAIEIVGSWLASYTKAEFGGVPADVAKRCAAIEDSALEEIAKRRKPIATPAEPEKDEDLTADPPPEAQANGSTRFRNMIKGDEVMDHTRQDAYSAMEALAKKLRQPGETIHEAYNRLLHTDPLMKQLYAGSKALPHAPAPAATPVTRAPNTVAKRVEQLCKEDPHLTPDRAMTKVYRELQAAH